MYSEVRLSVWDYVVVASSLVLCAVVGLVAGRGSSSGGVAQYLLAGRNMSIWPVAFSIMATLMSAIAMAGGVGEMYMYGVQFQINTVAATLTKILVAFFIVPIFHQKQYTSIYEYLESRFDRTVRLLFSAMYILSNTMYIGIVLYLPALALTTVTGIPYWVTSFAIGITCTFYCVAGGFKAVIWTDVIQTFLMFTCIVLILIKCLMAYGSFGDAWLEAYNAGMLNITWTEDSHTRFSIWSLIANGTISSFKNYTTNQAGVQRFLSLKDSGAAKKSLFISSAIIVVFKFILILLGVAIYVSFSRCDPLSYQESTVEHFDQIMIFAIWKYLTDIPGLAGLAFAGIISGSLSTYSSYINSFAALTLEDYLKPYFPAITKTERRNILICKILTGIYGILAIFISLVVPYLGGATKAYSTIVVATAGPLCGVMFLGFFIPKTSTKVVKISLLVGVLPCLWLATGAMLFPTTYRRIAYGMDQCQGNYTLRVQTAPNYEAETSSFDLPIYHISFMWNGFIGFMFTLLTGWILGYFFGRKTAVDPRLLSPIVAKYYRRESTPTPLQIIK